MNPGTHTFSIVRWCSVKKLAAKGLYLIMSRLATEQQKPEFLSKAPIQDRRTIRLLQHSFIYTIGILILLVGVLGDFILVKHWEEISKSVRIQGGVGWMILLLPFIFVPILAFLAYGTVILSGVVALFGMWRYAESWNTIQRTSTPWAVFIIVAWASWLPLVSISIHWMASHLYTAS
jgi:hypothetical protein